MGTKTDDKQTDDSTERTVGLYPVKKEKIVEPINAESDKVDVKIASSKKPAGQKPAKEPADKATSTSSSPAVVKSSLVTDESPPTNKEDKEVPDENDKISDADDNAAQVPDTEAALKTEFIDEGQYRITVPKKHRAKKGSALSGLLWGVFVVFLLLVAVYLYAEFFDIELEDIFNSVQDLIGQ